MSLIDFIEKNGNIRKLFGKRELVIIKKQLLGVKLTQSEKNRLSRDIRKKFEAIKALIPFEKEFKIKRGLENKKLIEEVKKEILNSEYSDRIKRIILFGSAAQNQLTLLSDIDIAAEFDKIDDKEAVEFILRIARYFSDRLDIQVYNALPEKIKKSIEKNGKVIYERDTGKN